MCDIALLRTKLILSFICSTMATCKIGMRKSGQSEVSRASPFLLCRNRQLSLAFKRRCVWYRSLEYILARKHLLGGRSMPVVSDTKQQVENLPRPTSNRPALNTVTTIALFGMTLAYFVNFLLAYVFGGTFVAPLLIIGGIMLVGACVSLLRVRWIGAVGALLALGAISTQMSVGINQYFITHPADAPSFITLLVILSFGLVAVVAGRLHHPE